MRTATCASKSDAQFAQFLAFAPHHKTFAFVLSTVLTLHWDPTLTTVGGIFSLTTDDGPSL